MAKGQTATPVLAPASGAAPVPAEPPVPAAPATSAALVVLAVLAVIVVVRYAADVFVPVVLAVFVSYALEPVVAWIAHRRVPRAIAAVVVLLALLAALGATVYGLSGDVMSLADEIPPAAERLRTALNARGAEGNALQRVQKAANEIERSAAEATGHNDAPRGVTRVQVEEKPFNVRGYVWTGSMGALGLLSQGVLLVFLLFFLLASDDLFKRKLIAIAGPSLATKRVTLDVLNEIERQVQLYFFVLTVANALVALASWLVFAALGLDRAIVWALAAGLFHSIPYVGPLAVSVSVGFLGFVQFASVTRAASLAAAELAITGVVGFVVVPWLVGRTARMNEVTIFIGLLFWAWMWGVVGMLLAVPMLVVVKVVCDHVEGLAPVAKLLAD
ncbi:MAG TPA: AI-2E family transporter [Candidatus Binatia bacterium]|nr:AI-2E family transporter [Candidatus Binatia bacterium]